MEKDEIKYIILSCKNMVEKTNEIIEDSSIEEKKYLRKIRQNFKNFIIFLKKLILQISLTSEEEIFIKEIEDAVSSASDNYKLLT